MTDAERRNINLANFKRFKELGLTNKEASDLAMLLNVEMHGHLSPAEEKRKARLQSKLDKLTRKPRNGTSRA